MYKVLGKSLVLLAAVVTTSIGYSADKPVINVTHWKTQNGASVYFVPSNQVPMVDIQVAFKAAAARDGEHPGLAALTNDMLNNGTATLNADQIASQLENVGAEYSSTCARDMAVVKLRSLSAPKMLQPAVSVFSRILSTANFPEKAFKREQRAQLASIKQSMQSASSVATGLFYKMLYGNEPYGHPVLGTKESVSQLSPELLKTFYQRYYVAKNATIAIVGDLNVAQAKVLANQLTANMAAGEAATKLVKVSELEQAKIKHVTFPSTQTNVRIGQLGIDRYTKDYFPLVVGNYILGGGGMVSRLTEQVREKRGLSYSVYSQFVPMATNGPFIVSLATRNNQAKEALEVAQKTLDDYVENGPTDAELKAAKQYLVGSYPMRFDSNNKIASQILVVGFYHLPINFYDTYLNYVKNVTKDDIKAAFSKHLNTKKMIVVTVGGNGKKS